MPLSGTNSETPPAVTPGAQRAPRLPSLFEVARVERTDAPDGSTGRDWYRYVLNNGRSTITGQRRGSRKDVTAHAAHYAEQLNARALGGPQSTSPPRKGKKLVRPNPNTYP